MTQEIGIRVSVDGKSGEAGLQRIGERLDDVGDSAQRAGGSIGKAGQQVELSAKQMQAALRGVPAQFTDIFTSLAAGQPPMQVLMQQGGQLKDMFGGAGNAAKALGGYVLGLVNPATVAAATVGTLALAYYQGSSEADAFSRALILNGNAAGLSTDRLSAYRQAVADSAGVTKSMAADALTQLAASGKVSEAALLSVAASAALMERATGKAISDSVKEFEALGKSPVAASAKLNEQYNYLTAAVYQQLKALEDQGKALEAANLAQETYANAMAGRSNKIVQNLGIIDATLQQLARDGKAAWDAALGVGRQDDAAATLEKAKAALAARRAGDFNSWTPTAQLEKAVAAAQAAVDAVEQAAAAEANRTRVQREGVAAVDAVTKANERALTKQEQMNKALADYRANIERVRAADPNSALLDPAKIAKAEKAIRDLYSDKGALKASENNLQQSLTARINTLQHAAQQELKIIKDRVQAGELTEYEGIEATRQATVKGIQAQLASERELLDATKDRGDRAVILERMNKLAIDWSTAETKANLDVAESARKRSDAYFVATEKENAALDQAIAKGQEELDAIGLTVAQKDRLRQASLDLSAKQADETAEVYRLAAAYSAANQNQEGVDFYTAAQAAAEQRAAKLRELASVEAQQAGKREAVDAARESADAWKKFGDDIKRSLTDGIYRGLEKGGKDGAQVAKNAIVNTLKAIPIRLMVEAVINPALGNVQSALMGGSAPGVNGYSGFDSLSSLSNLSMTPYANAYSNLATSSFGQTVGLSQSLGVDQFGDAVRVFTGAGEAVNSAARFLDSYGGYIQAAYSLSQGQYGAAAGAALGQAIAGPIGAAIGSAIGGMVDQAFAGGGGPKSGGDAAYGYNNGTITALADPGLYTPSTANAQVANLLAPVLSGLESTIARLGGSVDSLGSIAMGYDTDPSGSASNRVTSVVNGQVLSQDRDLGRDAAALEAGLAAEVNRITIAALKGIDLEDWADDLLSAIDPVTASSDALAVALNNLSAMAKIVPVLEQIGVSADEASIALVNALGGIDAAAQGVSAYFGAFYTEQEHFESASQNVQAALHSMDIAGFFADTRVAFDALVADTSRENFRALVDAQDLTTVSGQQTYAALIKLAPAFAGVTAAVDAATVAAEQAVMSAEDIAVERANLERQLLEAEGNTAALRQLELAALDATNRPIQEQIYLLEDAALAQEAYNTALSDAQAAFASAESAATSARAAVDAIQSAGTDAYLDAMDRVAAAQQNIVDIQLSAQQQIAAEARAAAEEMSGLAKTLFDFATDAAEPPSETFANLLRQALAGDADAMRGLTSAATAAIDATNTDAATTADARIRNAQIVADVYRASLVAEANSAYEAAEEVDPLIAANAELAAAQSELAEALRVANAISAPLERQVADLIADYNAALADLAVAEDELAEASRVLSAIEANTSATATAVTLNTAELVALKMSISNDLVSNFSALDTSMDGLLNYDEFRTAFTGLASDASLQTIFHELDVNGDGQLSELEAINLGLTTLRNSITSSLSANFDALDTSMDGLLNYDEFRTAFTGLASDASLQTIFRELDVNGDGQLSKLEAIRSGVATVAANTGSTVSGATMTVTFDVNDPLFSIFENIERSNVLLIDGLQLQLQMIRGQAIDENLQPVGAQNSQFDGTYKLQVDARDSLSAINANISTLVRRSGGENGGLHTKFARGASAGDNVFALGGVFTNGIVTRPTAFDMGLMGESTPEAIMPLSRSRDGSLGVRVQMPDFSHLAGNDNAMLVGEVRSLREENRAQASAIVDLNRRLTKLLERWDTQGIPETRAIA